LLARLPRRCRKVQRDVRKAGIAPGAAVGSGSLLAESVLVVNQKAKLIELNAEYAIYNQHGERIGAVREFGQSVITRALSMRAAENRTHRLQVVDADGGVLMTITRPAKFLRSKVVVRDTSGAEIGRIMQKNLGFIGNVRFSLEAGDQVVGSIKAESWDAWDFSIQDAAGNEIARITKRWAGALKEMFTKGDNYVVEIFRTLDEPLRSLVVAAAVAVDTALRQGDN